MAITYVAADVRPQWAGGTIYNGASSQHNYGFYIGVRETYVSGSTDNYSNVAIQIGLKNNNAKFSETGWAFKYTVDGVECDYRTGVNINTTGSGWTGDTRPIYIDSAQDGTMHVNYIPHNDSGSKTVHIKVEMYKPDGGYTSTGPGYCVVEGDFTLTTIPRKANITRFDVYKRDETSVTVYWSADADCDAIWYSTDNGYNWVGTGGNPFVISSLNPGGTYNFKIQVRRRDSQLSTYSDTYTQSTYSYPYISSAPSFTIGNQLTIGLYNPLSRSCQVYIVGNDNTQYGGNTTTGTAITGYNDDNWKNWWYSTIPNSQQGSYSVRLVCSSVSRDTTVNGGTYYITGNEKPTVTTTAIDSGKTTDTGYVTTTLTGNNKNIIKYISDVTASVSAVGNNGTTIASYSTKYNNNTQSGSSYTYTNVENTTFTGYATDNRGLSNSANASGLTLVEYIKLTLDDVELYRTEQTSNALKCRGNGNYFSNSFGNANNALVFKLRYKASDSTTWSNWETKTMTIGNNTYSFDFQVGTNFDYTKTYNFEFEVSDKCMLTTGGAIAKPGIPILGLFEDRIEAFGRILVTKD